MSRRRVWRAGLPLVVGLVGDPLGDRYVGVLADRLHDASMQLEVVLGEHLVLL